jgi:tight adherence protein B
MMLYLIIGALIAILFFGMVFAIRMNNEAERKRRIMSVIGNQKALEKGKKGSPQEQRQAALARKLKEVEEEVGKKKKENTLQDMIMQAGYEFSVQRYWVVSVILCILSVFMAKIMGYSLFVIAMAGIVGLLGLPRMFLKMSASKRQKKFLEDFADALDAMTRLLKAGMPVTESIKMVAREYTGPVGEEMSRIFDQQKIGIPLPEAVLNGAKRMPLPEMQMFATAVAIQTQTGSSLSDVLTNLAAVIRARFRLKRKVAALSSEAKASAMIIGALPCIVAGGMYVVNRKYIEVLFYDPTGKMLLGGAIFWMLMGCLVMRQMINFKV